MNSESVLSQLQAFREIEGNWAWNNVIYPKIAQGVENALNGLTDRSKSADERAQHVEAYHLAKALEELVSSEIERLTQLYRTSQPIDVMDIPRPTLMPE